MDQWLANKTNRGNSSKRVDANKHNTKTMDLINQSWRTDYNRAAFCILIQWRKIRGRGCIYVLMCLMGVQTSEYWGHDLHLIE